MAKNEPTPTKLAEEYYDVMRQIGVAEPKPIAIFNDRELRIVRHLIRLGLAEYASSSNGSNAYQVWLTVDGKAAIGWSLEHGIEERNAAMVQVQIRLNGEYSEAFAKAFTECVDRAVPFKAEDVRMRIPIPCPCDPRALGPLMLKHTDANDLVPMPHRAKGERSMCHGRPMTLWGRPEWEDVF